MKRSLIVGLILAELDSWKIKLIVSLSIDSHIFRFPDFFCAVKKVEHLKNHLDFYLTFIASC